MITPLGNGVRELFVIMHSAIPSSEKDKQCGHRERAARTLAVSHNTAQTLCQVNTARNKHSDA